MSLYCPLSVVSMNLIYFLLRLHYRWCNNVERVINQFKIICCINLHTKLFSCIPIKSLGMQTDWLPRCTDFSLTALARNWNPQCLRFHYLITQQYGNAVDLSAEETDSDSIQYWKTDYIFVLSCIYKICVVLVIHTNTYYKLV